MRSEATRVVHVLGSLDRGGAELVALDLCRMIPSAEVKQIFVCLRPKEGVLAERFRAAGAEVLLCPLRPLGTFGPRLWNLLRDLRTDVCVSHVSLVSGPVLLIARMAGVRKRIARIHSEGDGRRSTPIRRLFRGLCRVTLFAAATSITAVSTKSLEFALGGLRPAAVAKRSEVVPNGVDFERFACRLDAYPPSPVFTHIGRADLVKNRAFLVGVHHELVSRGVDHQMRLVGPGGVEDLGTLDLGDIQILGATDDVALVLQESSVLALPSLREGLPGVVLEALACGIPVVASDLPTVREVSKETLGVTVVSLDSGPAVWADALLLASETPLEKRRRIALSIRDSRYGLGRSVEYWRQEWK